MNLQQFRKFTPTTFVQAQRARLIISPFSLPASTWDGASQLLVEYALSNTNSIAFRKPIKKFGTSFIAAVRWTDGTVYYRFVFWIDPLAVLYFPTYNGETIGPNATIEIWSVNSALAPTLLTNTFIESSQLIFPLEGCSTCCVQPSGDILLLQTGPITLPPGVCNPFCGPVIPVIPTGACILTEPPRMVGARRVVGRLVAPSSCSIMTEAACIAAGGTYQGDNTTCPIPPTTGACTVRGVCSLMTAVECESAGGVYSGDSSTCPVPPLVPNQPDWPPPTPWDGSAFFGPIHAPGDTPHNDYFVGVNPGSDNPTTYTDGLSPGATAAWVAELWREFLLGTPTYSAVRIVWANVGLTGSNWTGFTVFPAMNPDTYADSIDLTYSPLVEYTP